MAKTLRERFCLALEQLGESQLDDNRKSIRFTRKEGGFYYLGKSGSLRFGMNKTDSIPCSNKFKSSLLALTEA